MYMYVCMYVCIHAVTIMYELSKTELIYYNMIHLYYVHRVIYVIKCVYMCNSVCLGKLPGRTQGEAGDGWRFWNYYYYYHYSITVTITTTITITITIIITIKLLLRLNVSMGPPGASRQPPAQQPGHANAI